MWRDDGSAKPPSRGGKYRIRVVTPMGEVVNLNQYRKNRSRDAERRAARENRIRFGRTGAEKASDRKAGER
ncbi:MAG TPA: DUF4169 family protein, partial [Alphaproteobacteria bacterium]